MDKILCPCGCGKTFTPEFTFQKYFSLACNNRQKQRAWRERERQKRAAAALNQSSLPFKRSRAKLERRVKSRSLAEQGREESKEERLFA